MPRKLALLWLGGLLLTAASATPALAEGTRHAIIIAIERYPDAAGLPDLPGTGKDAEAIRQALLNGGYADDHITMMTDQSTGSNLLPTRQNIEFQVAQLKRRTTDKDVVLVVSLTHGVVLGVDQQQVSFICPLNTTAASLQDKQLAGQMLLATPGLAAKLALVKAHGRLLVVDACRAANKGSANFAAELKDSVPNVSILSSCSEGELAYSDPRGYGSLEPDRFIFTHYLIKGLRGASQLRTLGGGRVGIRELYGYVRQQTRSHVAKQLGEKQSPVLRTSGTDVGFNIVEVDRLLPDTGETTGDPRIERSRTATVLAVQATVRISQADEAFMVDFRKFVDKPDQSGPELLNDHEVKLRYILSSYVDPALGLNPSSAEAHVVRGATYRVTRDYGRAFTEFEMAGEPMDVFAKTEKLVATDVAAGQGGRGGAAGGGGIQIPGIGGFGGLGGIRRRPQPAAAPAAAAAPKADAKIPLMTEPRSDATPLYHVAPGSNLTVGKVDVRPDGEWLLIVEVNNKPFKELNDGAFKDLGDDDGGWIHESQVDWFKEAARLYMPGLAVGDAFDDARNRYLGASRAMDVLARVQGGLAVGGLGGAAGWVGFARGIVEAVRNRKFNERWGAATVEYNRAVELNRRLAVFMDAQGFSLPTDKPIRLTALPWEATTASTTKPTPAPEE